MQRLGRSLARPDRTGGNLPDRARDQATGSDSVWRALVLKRAPARSDLSGFEFDRFPASAVAFGFPEVSDVRGEEPGADERCRRFHEDHSDGAGAMFSQQSAHGFAKTILCGVEGFSARRADRFRVFLELPVEFRLLDPQFFDPPPVPEAEIEVVKRLNDFDSRVPVGGEFIGGLPSGSAGTGVDQVDMFGMEGIGGLADLSSPVCAQGDIQGPFDAALLIKICRTGSNDNQSQHGCSETACMPFRADSCKRSIAVA